MSPTWIGCGRNDLDKDPPCGAVCTVVHDMDERTIPVHGRSAIGLPHPIECSWDLPWELPPMIALTLCIGVIAAARW